MAQCPETGLHFILVQNFSASNPDPTTAPTGQMTQHQPQAWQSGPAVLCLGNLNGGGACQEGYGAWDQQRDVGRWQQQGHCCVDSCTQNSHVEVLSPSTCEGNLIWK